MGNGPYRYLRHIPKTMVELAPLLRTDLPMTVLYPVISHFVVHRRIQGLRSHRSVDGVAVGTSRADPVWHMGELWLEEEET